MELAIFPFFPCCSIFGLQFYEIVFLRGIISTWLDFVSLTIVTLACSFFLIWRFRLKSLKLFGEFLQCLNFSRGVF